MKTELSKIAQDLEQGTIDETEAQDLLLGLLGVSTRTFTSTCNEVENMAVEIDQFIDLYALERPMTYSRKLRQYLATKLNEYVC